MRNREKYKILQDATNENNQLILDGDRSHDGEQYYIINSDLLFPALEIISHYSWATPSTEELREKLDGLFNNKKYNIIVFNSAEYIELSDYINNINSSIPIVLDVLATTFKEQDNYTISIMYPQSKTTSFVKLGDFNKEISDSLEKFVLKRYNGQFELTGFDTGTNWIDLIIVGLEGTNHLKAYAGIMGIILLAEKSLKLRTEYNKGSEVKYNALLAKRKIEKNEKLESKDIIASDLKEYINDLIKIKTREELTKIASETGLDNDNESINSFEKAIPILIKHMEIGAEYHHSLHPPKDIINSRENKINYSQLQNSLKNEREKQLKKDKPETIELQEDEASDSNSEEQ